MNDLVYLYAVLPAEAEALAVLRRGEVRGLEGNRVDALVEGGLAAAVSAVSGEEFEAATLNQLVRDLDWLGPRAACHQDVNAQLFAQAEALLPVAFGTVFRDTAGVVQLLRSHGAALRRQLAAVRGCAEWVITVRREAERAVAALDTASPALLALQREAAAATPGRAYLLSRRLETARREELAAQDARAATAALRKLALLATQTVPEEVADAGRQGLLLRVSALVDRHTERDWLAAAAELERDWQPRGYDIRLTGPWPPYRFSAPRTDQGVD